MAVRNRNEIKKRRSALFFSKQKKSVSEPFKHPGHVFTEQFHGFEAFLIPFPIVPAFRHHEVPVGRGHDGHLACLKQIIDGREGKSFAGTASRNDGGARFVFK